MDLGLKGRSAFIGGSTRGLGFAIARTLAAEGAQVLICGRNGEDVESARRQIARVGRVHGVAVDLSMPAGREAAVRIGLEAFGKIDITVINVGGPPTGGLELADVAANIASERASYLTGASITVDGGMVRTTY